MIDRYAGPRMKALWASRKKYETWLRVELEVADAMAALGKMPEEAVRRLRTTARVDPERIEELEQEVRHDVIAFLTMVEETAGPDARYLHAGLTSSDIVDTALALLVREASEILLEDLQGLKLVLADLARAHRDTLMIGRSHGVHAEPITFGLKAALWHEEIKRQVRRLERATQEVAVGKLSGAMGTYAHLPPEVEERVCAKLGLVPEPIASQVVQRDRHAAYLCTLALIAGTVEKIATEIRHLQRTEVLEAEEPFAAGQRGSSAMPHKRNPVGCENLVGLARVIRANAGAALENIALWHERDISHSSVERIVIPDSTTLLDFMLDRLTGILRDLRVYPERMRRNLEATGGMIYSQRVLLALVGAGVPRSRAYEIVQRAAMEAWEGGPTFRERIEKDPEVRSLLDPVSVAHCFDPESYLQHLDLLFRRTFDSV